MKKLVLITTTSILLASATTFAQHDHNQKEKAAASVDSSKQTNLSKLLTAYYGIKDALVAGNSGSASKAALQFVQVANTIDYKVVSEGNINALMKDANKIAKGNDIEKQRNFFGNFSSNMATVAKAVNLSSSPIYLQYCPMKKLSWLSNEEAIKNPYYGQQMLNCGNIADTIIPGHK